MINIVKTAIFECAWTNRMLGCRMSPKGNMIHKDPTADTEYLAKYQLAIDWAISMNSSNLANLEAHMTYHIIYKRK